MTSAGHPENPLTAYRTLDGDYRTYLDELEAIGAAIAGLLRPGGHLVLNVATITAGGQVTPLGADVAERVGRHLTLVADLPVHWDVASRGPHRRPLPRIPPVADARPTAVRRCASGSRR